MKILVFSDSHGNVDIMHRVAQREIPDQIIHLGDHARDARELAKRHGPTVPVCSVRGNTDLGDTAPDELTLNFCGYRFFITHGHRYNVKSTLLALRYRAEECGAVLALFGHTHVQYLQNMSGLWLLNPGAREKYAVVHIGDNGGFSCELANAY